MARATTTLSLDGKEVREQQEAAIETVIMHQAFATTVDSLPKRLEGAGMYNPTDEMCEERERLIGLLDAQLGFRPASAAWRDALHDLEYEVEGLLAREDNEVLGTRCSRFDAPMGPGQCDTIRRLRGYLPRLFDEARAAHPDIAFMGYLRLSATLRRWARGAGDAL